MICPRCGSELVEHEPDLRWQRWWECPECWAAYHWFISTRRGGCRGALVQGRMERQGYAEVPHPLYADGQTFACKVGG